MNEKRIINALRQHAGLRVGPHAAKYVSDRLAVDGNGKIALLAQDARTGVPLQTSLVAADLLADGSRLDVR